MPEVRLIDANWIASEMTKAYYENPQTEDEKIYNLALTVAKKLIRKAPTIEAEPVKHAKWESWGYVFHGIEWKRCSACGKCADVSYYGILDGEIKMSTPALCGCCGARMDEPPEEVQE